MNRAVYKVMDEKGRVLIPKEFRTASGMEYGGIIKLTMNQGSVTVKKVDLIEVGDQSPEAVEAFVGAAIREMSPEKQISMAATLLELLEQGKGQKHG